MARMATTHLGLGTWTDGENPGAGSQTVDSPSINGNVIKIDTAVGTGHNADGTHKAAVIDGANLKSTVVDGSTITQDGGTKKLGVPTGGIGTTQLADSGVTTAKIAAAAVTNAKVAASAVDTTQLVDAAVTTAKLADGSVTSAKLASAIIGTRQIFGDQQTAGTGTGNAAAAVTAWTENSTSGIIKVRLQTRFHSGDKYVNVFGTFVSNTTKRAYVDLAATDGTLTVSSTKTKTVPYTTSENFSLQLDISTLSTAGNSEITVTLRAESPATVTLSAIAVEISPS